ncbi:MAG: Nramp family divalent metal transporter [Nocardioidaceae bacterium]
MAPALGPAFVAAIAYADPGNFAANITAGSSSGYLLVWVVLVSNLMAMLIQYVSAKTGIATGRSLPDLCRRHFRRPVVLGLWVQAELVVMATDLAEVLGGALALQLLFGLPLVVGGIVSAAVAVALLGLRSRGHRPFETVIIALLGVILLGLVCSLIAGGLDVGGIVSGTVPRLHGPDTLLLATAMLGATVMPHAIYAHSALTRDRYRRDTEQQRRALLRGQRVDVGAAMAVAGLVNLAMLVVAARVMSGDASGVVTIQAAHQRLGSTLGAAAALGFALALLASGVAASSVGTYAGQVVMGGFVGRRIPLVLRRLVTLVPALIVLAVGVDPTHALVLSQVVLSFGIPFALVPLVILSRRADVMGALVNRRSTTMALALAAAAIICLNGQLVGAAMGL